MKSIVLRYAMVLLILGTLARPAVASPAREGTILGGVFTTGSATSCTSQADCAPWVLAGCPAAMTGINPAAETAIVSVADLAGTTRRFEIRRGGPESIILGRAYVEFWTSDCTHLGTVWDLFYCQYQVCERTSYDPSGFHLGSQSVAVTAPIPSQAAWMTISANDNVDVRWTLE